MSIACTRELLGIFSVAGRFEELEALKRRLDFSDREGGADDRGLRTEQNADAAQGVKEADGAIDGLDRLLSEVMRDHIEAAEEGRADADSMYADLESQICAAMSTAETLRRKFNRPLPRPLGLVRMGTAVLLFRPPQTGGFYPVAMSA